MLELRNLDTKILEAVAEEYIGAPVQVLWEDLSEKGAWGDAWWPSGGQRRIRLSTTLPADHELMTYCHEVAHHALGHVVRRPYDWKIGATTAWYRQFRDKKERDANGWRDTYLPSIQMDIELALLEEQIAAADAAREQEKNNGTD